MKRTLIILVLFILTFVQAQDFNEYRAFSYLEEQVAMGPRFPGSPGHATCRDWLIDISRDHADTVLIQEFTAYRPDTKKSVNAYNIIARFNPQKKDRVMLSAHWDTRPISDMDFFNSKTPVPGANDGASGVAVLVEIMTLVDDLCPDLGLDIVFWDAEDMGIAGSGQYFCQGSEFYARNVIAPKPVKGILIDMIGDADLKLPVEGNSMLFAPELVNDVWTIATELGYGHIFVKKIGQDIYDDHVPLNRIAGIPSIDIIDFDYRHNGRNLWHTPKDIPAYCSPHSLKYVGDVLLEWLSRQ
jgi:Zn-dependent M28 family amino/carboxypeptidase